jgi:hypothetical protein
MKEENVRICTVKTDFQSTIIPASTWNTYVNNKQFSEVRVYGTEL